MRQLVLALVFFAAPLSAADDPAENVSEARLRADIDTLVAFGTRHTLSEQDNPTRGIGAAVDWGAAEFRRIANACGDCLEVVLPERIVTGPRVPQPVRLRNAVAIQRGSERPNEVVIVQGHIDSRVSDVMDWQSDAPGANDDGSGTALVLEAARVLSQQQYPTTIIYALLSGEEQGLLGGRLLADWVEEQGFTVKAVLNNDIVGGSCGSDGWCDDAHVRLFSEGPRADLTDELRAAQRREGGENDTPSRNLSRYIDQLADQYDGRLDVRQIWRADRMGRGGDQLPFLEKGYPAVRITVAVENYNWQHQDLRTEDGVEYGDTPERMDFPYLARVTQLNIRALDALARTPAPPVAKISAAVSTDTEVTWSPVEGASAYEIWVRRTDEPSWGESAFRVLRNPEGGCQGKGRDTVCDVPVSITGDTLKGIRGDDWIFGVSACTESGLCSPVSSAVPAGQYAPVAPKKDDSE